MCCLCLRCGLLVRPSRPTTNAPPHSVVQDGVPQAIVDLYEACTEPDPAARPSARDAYHVITRVLQDASGSLQGRAAT